jgi:hypothetical protein
MQLLLPIFPIKTKLITESLGVYERDGIIFYLHCGVPIHQHHKDDMNNFRFVTSHLVRQKMCRQTDIVRVFGVSEDSVSRYYKKYETEGESAFFGKDNRSGKRHKLIGERLERVQAALDKGESVYGTAKKEGVSEGALRYAIIKGYLKKTKQTTNKKIRGVIEQTEV